MPIYHRLDSSNVSESKIRDRSGKNVKPMILSEMVRLIRPQLDVLHHHATGF